MITSVHLIQVGNNRNGHFRYFLGVHTCLIKVSFKANKGNKFWDFGFCPLNRGCPLNTGFTVRIRHIMEYQGIYDIVQISDFSVPRVRTVA